MVLMLRWKFEYVFKTEFLLFPLPQKIVAQRMLDLAQGLEIKHEKSCVFELVSVSIGIALYSDPACCGLFELLDIADKALYQ
ncbi:MAG: hypothetical protein JKY66_07825 [Spongiibacteraceae bacterium]|nr:hypothetical protein [Spongiibacteraceae bacterium]